MDQVQVRWRSVPKPGETDTDNEDRCDHLGGRIAMADGASRTARPDIWAELLVSSFVRDGNDPLDPVCLAALRTQWLAAVSDDDLPWYATAKIAEGGAATFLAVETDIAHRRYHARGIGDTCLLHVRGGDVLIAGPLHRVEDFGRRPALVSTVPARDTFIDHVWEHRASCEDGDALILATDAAAAYLLGAGAEVRQELVQTDLLTDTSEFADWVDYARSVGGMAPDDTTVCVVML
ncbi:hypothetical protein [Nocardia gamkensis]|uniref:PPM-type phosphatase domain-containing protein n=1 Tax=Nocardia gamkensis TaxID=352869 RepID=A0A7X6R3W0_9NOCA|nr:hypothetical protein [Nocardia gamkensis]NKY27773.1 hypothetical protein [Nocardia gamkensis]NQE67414.1 hypothetical protein [Nocardia gamkensis]